MPKRRISVRDIVLGAKRRRVGDGDAGTDAGDEVRRAVEQLAAQFPADSFRPALPRVVLKHQLYSACRLRATVDQEVQRLREAGALRLFKIGAELDDSFAVVRSAEFEQFAARRPGKVAPDTLRRFLDLVLRQTPDLSLSAGDNLPFDDATISDLVQSGFLTVRDLGCYWVACPDMGNFVAPYRRMRARIMRTIRRQKYKEMLRTDLELRLQRPQLPLDYMLHDLVGAGLLRLVETSGRLYRICD